MINVSSIKDFASEIEPQLKKWRHHIHANPELSYQEYETAKYVTNELKNMGLQPVTGIADTGIYVLIKGQNPNKKTVALRADMDALPIEELNDVPYKSTKPGIMHACGHDVHTSCLLGAAKILNHVKDSFEGTIKLIFQPGEEKTPGGASLMIKEGILENPTPQSIIGQHVMPFIPAGKIGFREGLYMASADELYITIKGKGGHGAMPHLNKDTVLMASHMIVALQQIVSRVADPKIPSVLSFGKVIANGATNVMPNEVFIEGTFRTMDELWREQALVSMKTMAIGIVEAMGGICEFDIHRGYPFLYNDPHLTKRLKHDTQAYVGAENVVDLDIWMAAEDFSYYAQHIPGCFYRLGTGNEAKGITSSVHTPTFDIDETALPIGAGLMAWLALSELTRG
jgi:amidohydrolase